MSKNRAPVTASQILELMERLAEFLLDFGESPRGAVTQISIWEDDPYSQDAPTPNPSLAATTAVPIPSNPHPLLQTRILETAPSPGSFTPGTPEFRYWLAAEALARGINFWAPLLPSGTRWKTYTVPMRIGLVAGEDLNAYYDRAAGLRFFQQVVRNIPISSAESADVVCHELGHAILDAIRPELFNTASLEVAAFHESFGDMSGMLCALQLPTMRQKVLAETGGKLNVNSRLSRLAEQLGWAIRQLAPSAVDGDCLRNAANRFFYTDPRFLPPSAPASQLSSESHSFSRVFTGAFLDILARMLPLSGSRDDAGLQQVSRDIGQLLVNAVLSAPITSGYFSRIAAGMIQADQTLFEGRYKSAITSGFVQRGILAPGAAAEVPAMRLEIADEGPHTRTAEDAPDLPTRSISTPLGITIQAHAAEQSRFEIASEVERSSPDDDAAAFVEDLIQTGRIQMDADHAITGTERRATHTLVPDADGTPVLKRLHFDCGFCIGR